MARLAPRVLGLSAQERPPAFLLRLKDGGLSVVRLPLWSGTLGSTH